MSKLHDISIKNHSSNLISKGWIKKKDTINKSEIKKLTCFEFIRTLAYIYLNLKFLKIKKKKTLIITLLNCMQNIITSNNNLK